MAAAHRPQLDAGRRGSTPEAADRAQRIRNCFMHGMSPMDVAGLLGLAADTIKTHYALLRLEGLSQPRPARRRVNGASSSASSPSASCGGAVPRPNRSPALSGSATAT
jgi:hypothetical protein